VLSQLGVVFGNNTCLTWKPFFVVKLKEHLEAMWIGWLDGFTENQIKSKHGIYRINFKKDGTLPLVISN
jgi:hypothetical protein